MLCPSCKTQLTITDRQGVEIDFCPTCRGVWLDRGELDKLIEHSLGDAQRMETTELRRERAPRSVARTQYDDDDDHDDDGRYAGQRGRRRKGWLGDLFDFG